MSVPVDLMQRWIHAPTPGAATDAVIALALYNSRKSVIQANEGSSEMVLDPYDRADNPHFAPREYWGQLRVDIWLCVLEKGKGKIPFDPAVHSEDRARTALNIAVVPLAEQNVQFALDRELIAEPTKSGDEWLKIVWPSLRKLGFASTRDLNGKWVKCHIVPSGHTYTDKKSGNEREATTFEFLDLYPDEAACRAAYLAAGGKPADDDDDVPDIASAPLPQNDGRKIAALEFVKVLVKSTKGDRDALAREMATIPMIAEFFSVDSPEVRALLAA